MKKLVLLLLFGYLAASQFGYLAAASQTMESTIPPRIVRGIIKIDKSEPRQEGPGWRAAHFKEEGNAIKLTFNPAFESPPVFVVTPSGAFARIEVYAVSKDSVYMVFVGKPGGRGYMPWQWELTEWMERKLKERADFAKKHGMAIESIGLPGPGPGDPLGMRINFIAIDSK